MLLAVTLIQRSIGFGRGVLFCRWLEPEQLGQWEMAFSFLLLAAPLAVLGIPGSFGRYLEHYRRRNQLRSFLRRTALGTGALVSLALVAIVMAAPHFSKLIFGSVDHAGLVMLVAASLAAVILHHYLEALFAGLRMFRVVSVMQFCQSVGFAALGLWLLCSLRLDVSSIIIAYGGACFLSSLGALIWFRGAWSELPKDAAPCRQSLFWSKLLRFACWVWVINLLANLFAVVDRYMIMHFGGMDSGEALGEVGHYHSSRIVPLLMVSVADLLSGIVLPHLSYDWEGGRRREVSERLNLILKWTALGMFACGTLVLVASPLLFEIAFSGKYAGGRAVLPMTLAYCTWYGLFVLAQTYLWCAEKTRLATVPVAIALLANVVLNLLLLPHFGLTGAVLGTTLANAVCLSATFAFCRLAGMRVDRGTVLLCAAPVALCVGPWFAVATCAAVAWLALCTESLMTRRERQALTQLVRDRLGRFRPAGRQAV